MKIDKRSRMPLYSQLMDILIAAIEKELKENDQIPSERDICEKYDVSRTTVRQAINELEKEGYIYKIHGKGTFVAPKRVNQDLIKFYSFTEDMKKIGKKPTSKVLDFNIINIDSYISRKIRIMEGELVYRFNRLRLADNIPMMLETTYVSYARFPGLTKEDLEREALYDLIQNRFNTLITYAEETFTPILTNETEAHILNMPKEIPSLKIERFTYAESSIIEYTTSIARGDKFKYRVKLER
ncbi:GntR family transcriptional regulator [Candidatus Clostridium radicumherbarum]|uniref:GntR family transcriptional regulator n=1 Tax=Candidatus Clostridium radicumherbarum TaxID=3381662 RepID=A0ABW8TQC5_9CLOT